MYCPKKECPSGGDDTTSSAGLVVSLHLMGLSFGLEGPLLQNWNGILPNMTWVGF